MMEIASTTVLRLWQVFFSDPQAPGFWRWLTRPGFRHVAAAAYYADQDRWVFVQPSRHRLEVMVLRPEEATRILAPLFERATVVLQVEGREDRRFMPAMFGCVGALQSLLGISTRALAPYGLYRHLRANGAKVIAAKEPPCVTPALSLLLRLRSLLTAMAAPGGARPSQGDTGARRRAVDSDQSPG